MNTASQCWMDWILITMYYYNLYKLSSGKEYVCCASINGYERAVRLGKDIAAGMDSIYVKSIPVEDWREHDYQLLPGSKYYDY